jgi:polysaccharide deacetylase 2 family uncharacterized protein YibQ
VALFLLGEAWLVARTDSGALSFARWTGLGDRARVTQVVGRQLRAGLDRAGVPADSIREARGGGARVQWRAGLPPDASLLQANFAVHRWLEDKGIEVLAGREHAGAHGESELTLVVGVHGRATHELTLSRPARTGARDEPTSARLAIVLYGFATDVELAHRTLAAPLPFAVAIPPGLPHSGSLFHSARESRREIVLHLPLEPINYPQVSPGPGAILVTMKPSQVASLTRRYLDQAQEVAAVANLMGSLATQDVTVMGAVYRELRRQRVPFLHVSPAAGSVCRTLAAELGVDYDEPDAVVDAESRQKDAKQLDQRWKEILDETRLTGHRIVLLRATPVSLGWLPRALDPQRLKGVRIVPLSSILSHPAVL